MDLLIETLSTAVLFIGRSWLRYLAVGGVAFLLFWRLLPDRLAHRRCQPGLPEPAILRAEFRNSMLGIIFFNLPAALSVPLYRAGYLHVDFGASASIGTVILGFALFVVGADAWFYWVHRGMHDSRVYRWTHQLHHLSEKPSPLASYSFSLAEGFMLGLYLPLVLLLVTVDIRVLAAFVLFFSLSEAYVHLGYELLPRRFAAHPVTRWIGTSVFHNMHHEDGAYNFGIYFIWWDRLLGTMHPEYEARFEQVTARPLLSREVG